MLPTVSLIIPSYNRWELLQKNLMTLAQQSYSPEKMELIVVDDGSVPAYPTHLSLPLPFTARIVRQTNQGASAARNAGVQQSQGDILIFLDDDICLIPVAVAHLVAACQTAPQTIAQGKIVTPDSLLKTVFAQTMDRALAQADQTDLEGKLPFAACKTGCLAVWRTDFAAIGDFYAPYRASVAWEDVIWAYRAHQQGYDLLLCSEAVANHWDYAIQDVVACGERWKKAGMAAKWLLAEYPELSSHFPMFRDKLPSTWQQDSVRLILRKGLRQLFSAKMIAPVLLWFARRFDRWGVNGGITGRIYLLYVNGCFYRGFRAPHTPQNRG